MKNDVRDWAKPALVPPEASSKDGRWLRRIGIVIVLTMFGGFGTWAALAPLSSASQAQGTIVVEGYRKTVQHLEGGIVKSIAVRDGQAVEKDEVLITLEDTQPRAQLEVLRGQLFTTLAREARLVAQRDGLGRVAYPHDLLASQNDARVKDAIRVQDQIFRVRKTGLDGEAGLYEQQIGQLHAKAGGLRAQKTSRELLVRSFQSELEDFQALLKQGYAEKQKVREFERNLASSESQLGDLLSSLAATDLQVSETKLKILQLQKDLQREVAKDLSEVQTQLFEVREKLQSVQDTVERTVVRAPQAGTVLDLTMHTLGGVVRPGVKLLDIVPQGEKLVVDAKVSLVDIHRVRIGQIAEIRFTAFKQRDTPKIDGKVIALSADRLIDEADERKAPYYLARIEITPKGRQDLSRYKLDLISGMPAEVLINTGERTMFKYLTDPLRNTLARSFNEE
jgi:membrane fusion protein, epimerase transport system